MSYDDQYINTCMYMHIKICYLHLLPQMEVVFKTVGIIYRFYRLKVNSYVGSRDECSLSTAPNYLQMIQIITDINFSTRSVESLWVLPQLYSPRSATISLCEVYHSINTRRPHTSNFLQFKMNYLSAILLYFEHLFILRYNLFRTFQIYQYHAHKQDNERPEAYQRVYNWKYSLINLF